MKSKVAAVAVLLLLVVFWLGLPIYEFFAYRGEAPMLPARNWVLTDEAPSVQKLLSPDYAEAGDAATVALAQHRQTINAPAISAAMVIDGQIVWAGASGWADVDQQTPATPASRFRLGSTSKAVTATVLARLVQNGTVSLDTPIGDYFPDIPAEHWKPVTLRQLASHTAGVPHYGQVQDKVGRYHLASLQKHFTNATDALWLFDDTPLLFEPGSSYHYSSLDTVLLSAALEQVTGKTFPELVKQELVEPRNLSTLMPDNEQAAQRASFYWNDEGRSNLVRRWRKVDLSHRLAAGGFIATPSDVAQVGIAFIDDGFIQPHIRKTFWTPVQTPGQPSDHHSYALGWRVSQIALTDGRSLMHANHGGVSRGSQSWLMVIPELNMSVAVMINANTEQFWDFGSVSYDLVEAFLSHTKAASLISTIDSRQRQPDRTELHALSGGLILNWDKIEPGFHH